jgi:hypothetical protein
MEIKFVGRNDEIRIVDLLVGVLSNTPSGVELGCDDADSREGRLGRCGTG